MKEPELVSTDKCAEMWPNLLYAQTNTVLHQFQFSIQLL